MINISVITTRSYEDLFNHYSFGMDLSIKSRFKYDGSFSWKKIVIKKLFVVSTVFRIYIVIVKI